MERRWRAACNSGYKKVAVENGGDKATVSSLLPTDSEISEAFSNRKKRLMFNYLAIDYFLSNYCEDN